MFSDEVSKQLKYYVYRLLDPRTGETFYIGKGRGNRIFQHAAGVLLPMGSEDEDAFSLKQQRILAIRAIGLEVQHIVHRHGLSEREAFEVEAALIDAYPGLANAVGGHGSGDRGTRHSEEIIIQYASPMIEFQHSVLAISITRSIESRSVYDAVRGCWRINRVNAAAVDFVLAETGGLVVGVYVADEWVPATPEDCDWLDEAIDGRSAFIGHVAEDDIQDLYLQKRLPARPRGAVTPFRYFP